MSWLLPLPVPALLRSPRPSKIGSASDQIRGIKTALCSSYVLFSHTHADLGVSSCSLLNPDHVSLFSFFFFFLFPFRFRFRFRFAPLASRDNSFRSQSYTPHSLVYFDFSPCQTYTVLSAHFSFSHTSFWQKSPQPSRFCLCPSPSLRRFNGREGYRSVNFSL